MICIDMDMPKNCDECRFFITDDPRGYYCSATQDEDGYYKWVHNKSIKLKTCPLKIQTETIIYCDTRTPEKIKAEREAQEYHLQSEYNKGYNKGYNAAKENMLNKLGL